MASFGSFETEQEVYSDAVYTVYLARKSGDAATEYALKVFHWPASDEVELTGQVLRRDELERARVNSIDQQQRAAANSRFVAPILERGRDERGIWYVTRFCPRSVNKMMNGKVALPRTSLEHVIRSIAQGALDFKRTCGRAHGDLRPPNIQVSRSPKLTEAAVMLCDPLPGGEERAAEYEKSDLHALGVILLQLVRQRIFNNDDLAVMFPIGPSDEWIKVFGSEASNWLALCNRLLDPNLAPERFRLEDLVARLDELKPARHASSKLALVGAALVLALGIFGFWMLRPGPGMIEVTSDPPGATLVVDQTKVYGTAPVRLKFKRGEHVVEARLDQYGLAREATNCVVESGKVVRVHFQFAYGSVVIRSDPPGATIFRDGVAIGTTSRDSVPLIVAPGPVTYQLKLDQYEPAVVVGQVGNRQRVELAATLHRVREPLRPKTPVADSTPIHVTPAKGTLELSSEPVPAAIFDSEGHELGRATPGAPLRLTLAPGTYALTARAGGLGGVPATLQLDPGATNKHTFAFEYGTVDWRTEPTGASVSRGAETKVAPATFLQQPGVTVSYVIGAPGYQSVTNEVLASRGQRKTLTVTLRPELLSVELTSDPPGAEMVGENGETLARAQGEQSMYYLPWGPTDLVARYAMLGSVTNHLELKPGQSGARARFQFDYGTLVLTNLPPDLTVYEGDTRIGAASDQVAYQKRGAHLYALRGTGKSMDLATNIHAGLNFFSFVTAQKSWKNSFGMWFAWVPYLPGGGAWPGQGEPGGWVGVTEVTQGEYKKMDGSNPSYYREGGDNCPVENLTRAQAENFCRWLSGADTAERLGWHYALPTDAQFAAFGANADRLPRITAEGRMNSDADELFPIRSARVPGAGLNNARTHPEPVASTRQANQYGLYDVVGNVWEWLAGPAARDNTYAGGSYLNFSARTVSVKAREKALEKGPNIGFRVVLVPAD